MSEEEAESLSQGEIVAAPALSVVVPLHNEEESVALLVDRIEQACGPLPLEFELVLVDDGSTDTTWKTMDALEARRGSIVLVRLSRNCGQTAAIAAGFEVARGETIITMDGDLQNDPADIPHLLARCDAGYDLVCGWRKNRQDRLVSRKIPSKCANWLIRRVTGVKIHDYGCSLKAFRRDLVQRMRLYSDMHRFLPFLSQQVGARVDEIVVQHHSRQFGHTKYGIGRTWKVLLDLISLKMLVHYQQRAFLWFILIASPLIVLSLVTLGIALQYTGKSGLVITGTGLIVGSVGTFVLLLGAISNLVLSRSAGEFEHLLVRQEQPPAEEAGR
ncbi:MAG: glycosyltransferase family 2 protein [Planctomycetota bacterium]|jgi:glycosyltransferase involved in cell wall biosynthesis